MKRLRLVARALAWYANRARCEFLDQHRYVETWHWTGQWRGDHEATHHFLVCRVCRSIKLGSDWWE